MSESWIVIGDSVQGTSHQRSGVPCQDVYVYKTLPTGGLLMAVADGAGSAAHSLEGAQHAVQQVVSTFDAAIEKNDLTNQAKAINLMKGIFRAAHQGLLDLSEHMQAPLNEFACTLTTICALDGWMVSAQIGDGIAIAEDTTGHFFPVTIPQHGEYANETYFLTHPHALDTLDVQTIKQPLHSLTMMTDGMIRLALQTRQNQPHPGFFRPLVDFIAGVQDAQLGKSQLHDFLTSKRVCSRTDDDKTLVIAVRMEE